MTETYVAYAATQQLMKECTRHADYTIPQALEKNGEIPRDETGAHLGVSDSWWFKGGIFLKPARVQYTDKCRARP